MQPVTYQNGNSSVGCQMSWAGSMKPFQESKFLILLPRSSLMGLEAALTVTELNGI